MLRRSVHIHEPQWRTGQSLAAPEFLPLSLPDNNHADWRELRIFVDFWRRGDHRAAGMTGIFSPKFQLKSGISGECFLAFAREQSAADVCFINVFPSIPHYAYNVWQQGEGVHPGLIRRAQALLDAAGIGWDLSATPRHNHTNTCFGNFWVGTPCFWDGYVGNVLDPVARYLETLPGSDVARAVLEPAPYLVDAPYLPFIAERLFSTYLSRHAELAVVPMECSPQANAAVCTAFRRDVVDHLRERVDAADATGHFAPDLLREMAFASRMVGQYHNLYYQIHPHPHLGGQTDHTSRSAT